MAKCPVHREKTGSLSITDMGQGKTRLHCFGGCDQADVLKAAGLEWKDLRPGDVPAEIRQRMSLEDWKESLERQLGLVMLLYGIEKEKRGYWAVAGKRIRAELEEVRLQIEPAKVLREYQGRRFQERLKKCGIERLWEELYGKLPNAGIGTELRAGEIRSDSLRSRPSELPHGGVRAGREEDQLRRADVGRSY